MYCTLQCCFARGNPDVIQSHFGRPMPLSLQFVPEIFTGKGKNGRGPYILVIFRKLFCKLSWKGGNLLVHTNNGE